ncbi:Uncharacterized protein APZ42_018262 [Daphnia magna]|uniref:ATP-dependent DNA helicase n=1 Tax=Daphnia magna TaxID=35525 RepID=A0A162CHU9_9CRUS|nr:Uncharacterized protein APZ42_018262 [Daphnia magna]
MRHADGFLTSADPAYKTGKPIGNVDVLIGNESYNEYTANDKLMYNAFPFLFVTGKTLPSFSSLSAKFIRHMLRIKAHRESMEAFGRWVESHEFKNDLCEAAKDPISPKAKCLLKRIVPHTIKKGFPSEDDGLLDGLVHGESHIKSISIDKYSLRVRLTMEKTRASINGKKGIFGCGGASFGVVEEQEFLDEISQVIDQFTEASLLALVHVDKFLNRVATQEYRSMSATRWKVDLQQHHFEDTTPGEVGDSAKISDKALRAIEELRLHVAQDEPVVNVKDEKENMFLEITRDLLIVSYPEAYMESDVKRNSHQRMATFRKVCHFWKSSLPSDVGAVYKRLRNPVKQSEISCSRSTLNMARQTSINTSKLTEAFPKISRTYRKLNSMRKVVVNKCAKDFTWRSNSDSSNLAVVNILLPGGPGTGKSFVINALAKTAKAFDMQILIMSLTGIAASNLLRGQTVHNALHYLSTYRTRDILIHEPRSNLPSFKMNYKQMVSECWHQLQQRILFSGVVKHIIYKVSLDDNSEALGPKDYGAELFATFQMFELH